MVIGILGLLKGELRLAISQVKENGGLQAPTIVFYYMPIPESSDILW